MSRDYRACSLPICRGTRLETVHKMPASGARRDAWLAVLNDYQDLFEKLQSSFICARHFRPEDYIHAESNKLNRVAVPSLNIKELNQLDICKQVKTYSTDHNTVEAYEKANTLQCRVRTEAKRKNIPNVEEIECKRKTLNTSDDTPLLDDEQNEFIILDELKPSLLASYDEIETNDNSEDEEEGERDEDEQELEDEIEEILLANNSEIAREEEAIGQASLPVNDSADLSSSNDINIQLESHKSVIHHVNFSHSLHLDYLWLRDLCKCADCYDCAKHERLFDVTALSLKLRAESVTLFQDNILLIEWNDGHVSKYVLSELFELHQPQKSSLIPESRLTWSAKHTEGANFKAMSYNDLISYDIAIKTAFKRLQRTGILIIKDISANALQKPFMLELLLRRLFPHNSQNHLKEERSNFHNSQSLPHTNCTFLSESCGFQILSLSPASAAEMAKLNIVDGLNAVQLLSQNSPQALDYLTQYKIPLIYRNAQNYDYHTEASIIELDNGEVKRIKFAPYQRGIMPQKDMQEYTEALGKLTTIIKQKPLQWKLRLSSHKLLILDNWRICWQVENMESNVVLDCIYMERKEFLSQLHCLQSDSLD